MRVIGGLSRGRRLPARLPEGVRPTSDRVRESIFDILGSMGGVEGLVVADLFCGSGALGIEARSRGAAAVTFVDNDRGALDATRANLAAVGLAPATAAAGAPVRLSGRHQPAPLRAERPRPGGPVPAPPIPGVTLVRGDLPGWLRGAGPFDLVLCDPPYTFDRWAELLGSLRAPVAVLESSRRPDVPAPWTVTKARQYGGTLVTVVRKVVRETVTSDTPGAEVAGAAPTGSGGPRAAQYPAPAAS